MMVISTVNVKVLKAGHREDSDSRGGNSAGVTPKLVQTAEAYSSGYARMLLLISDTSE